MLPYRLYIFDLDGTLIDSAGGIADALNESLADHGLPHLGDEEVTRLIGRGASELVRRALPADRAADKADVLAGFIARYRAAPCRRTTLRAGAAEALAGLPGVKAVATNKPGDLARQIVAGLGIAPHLLAVLGQDDVGRRKPDPEMVRALLSRAAIPASATLFIGDSLVDAATARAAEVDLALISGGYEDQEQLAGEPARYRLAELSDLLAL